MQLTNNFTYFIRRLIRLQANCVIKHAWSFWSNPVIKLFFDFCIRNDPLCRYSVLHWMKKIYNLKEQHLENTAGGATHRNEVHLHCSWKAKGIGRNGLSLLWIATTASDWWILQAIINPFDRNFQVKSFRVAKRHDKVVFQHDNFHPHGAISIFRHF